MFFYLTYSPEGGDIPSQNVRRIDSGIQIKVPLGFAAILKSRSSLALKNVTVEGKIKININFNNNFSFLFTGGVIDNDYTGTIQVILCNRGSVDYHYNKAERIAQLIIVKLADDYVRTYEKTVEEENRSKIIPTTLHAVISTQPRGKKGFGSTGK
jgi:dUTPase